MSLLVSPVGDEIRVTATIDVAPWDFSDAEIDDLNKVAGTGRCVSFDRQKRVITLRAIHSNSPVISGDEFGHIMGCVLALLDSMLDAKRRAALDFCNVLGKDIVQRLQPDIIERLSRHDDMQT